MCHPAIPLRPRKRIHDGSGHVDISAEEPPSSLFGLIQNNAAPYRWSAPNG
jgi:hypothetical protein